jgi:uncharacterized protein YggT (Ycf19 family)
VTENVISPLVSAFFRPLRHFLPEGALLIDFMSVAAIFRCGHVRQLTGQEYYLVLFYITWPGSGPGNGSDSIPGLNMVNRKDA